VVRVSTASRTLPGLDIEVNPQRLLATVAVAVTMTAYLSVLLNIVTVAGDPALFYAEVAVAVVAGAGLARLVRPRIAGVVAAGLLVAGGYLYFASLPTSIDLVATLGPLAADALSMLSGLSILRIINAGVWALAITPAPTLLAAYLAVRGQSLAAATVAGAALGLFVLTGDADPATTLIGVVGVAGAAGFGDLARDDSAAVDEGRRDVLLGLGSVVAVASVVDVVPGELAGGSLGSFAGTGTTEANLLGSSERVNVLGAIELSPQVRFSVESEEAGYWRVGSFDRFTGDGWVRTGESTPYEGRLPSPPGDDRRVRQTFTMEGQMGNMPALWKPAEVERSATGADVLADGSLRPLRAFTAGESYTVESQRPVAGPRTLRAADTEYSQAIRQRYLALPGNTPDRVAERAARITANATNPYDTARVVERWLSNNRDYSLDVTKPAGNIADKFLFEMSAGYCTYFATTMVVMLRTQGIPARFTVGYTPGERVAESRWVARGLDAHAWVEVFFPDHGWFRFDPTPAGPREAAEDERIGEARDSGFEGVDTNETGPGSFTETPEPGTTPTPTGNTAASDVAATPDLQQLAGQNSTTPAGADADVATGDGGGGGFELPDIPPREQLALGAVVALGAVAGVRKSGLAQRAYREVWLRYQPRSDPITDTQGAYRRIEYVLSQQARPRADGETVRQYAEAVGDHRARQVARLYERATYAGSISETEADEAVSLADAVVSNRGVR
jgi:transglutaminase-like putative cysteine protease